MKIKMKTLAAGPAGVFLENQVYTSPQDLSDEFATALVAGGYAEQLSALPAPVEEAVVETADAPAEVVEAAVPVRPRGRGRTPKEE